MKGGKMMRTFEEMVQDGLLDRILYNTRGARHYEKDYDETKNCDYEKCKSCGGKCCKRCGCFFSPDDFPEVTYEVLKEEIDKGYITIELIDGDPYFINGMDYVLHVRNVDAPVFEGRLYSRPRTQCILLTDSGCKLDYEHRPTGGKLLIPGEKGNDIDCHGNYGVKEAMREWKNHQKVLSELIKYYQYHNPPCII